jgi:broad specificity phosphatase PhoE
MATTLYLIRHGVTEGNGEKRYKGSIDVPISAEGIEQIKRSSGFIRDSLNGGSLAAVYASPLSRARDSASVIAESYGLEPVVVDGLKERSFGIWEGMSLAEIHKQHPDAFSAWAANPLEHSPVGGESTLEVRDRIIPVVDEIISRHCDEKIAIVAHGGVNRVILCYYLCMPLEHIFRIEQDNAAVNIIKFYEKYPVAKLINWTGIME